MKKTRVPSLDPIRLFCILCLFFSFNGNHYLWNKFSLCVNLNANLINNKAILRNSKENLFSIQFVNKVYDQRNTNEPNCQFAIILVKSNTIFHYNHSFSANYLIFPFIHDSRKIGDFNPTETNRFDTVDPMNVNRFEWNVDNRCDS